MPYQMIKYFIKEINSKTVAVADRPIKKHGSGLLKKAN